MLGVIVLYAPACIAATLRRHARVEGDRWRPAFAGGRFPWVQYLGVAFWSYVATVPFLALLYAAIVTNVTFDLSTVLDRIAADPLLRSLAPEILAFSVLGALQGAALCLLLDWRQQRPEAPREAMVAAGLQGGAFLAASFIIHDAFRGDVWSFWFDWSLAGVFGAATAFFTLLALRPSPAPAVLAQRPA